MVTLFTIKCCLSKDLEDSCWKTQKIPQVLISNEQTAYVKGRFICETCRLKSDIIEVGDVFNINGFLVMIDIKKTFDSLNHSLLLALLKKNWFWDKFINC